jgi:hypothetical protein
MEGDLEELEAEGFLRLSGGSSDSVVCKLALTTAGRAAAREAPRVTELDVEPQHVPNALHRRPVAKR